MKLLLRILAVAILVFLGFGGVFGAWMLITDPSGAKFEWSLDLLNGTPFRSFLIPGIVLMLANGLLPLFIAVLTILKKGLAVPFIIVQGIVVLVWLTAQLIFNPDFFVAEMHYPTYLLGLVLIIIGLVLRKQAKSD